ncbi:MAG: hypothetical protein WD049_04910 [Candidatus Paceibacterota bacterium]
MQISRSPFEAKPASLRNASITPNALGGIAYANGYFVAADLLTKHAKANNCERDLLVFPICYLYRHNLELQLKELIATSETALGLPKHKTTHHRVKKLWNLARTLLIQADPKASDADEFKRVDRLMDYIDLVDADAQSFRFPVKTDGSASLNGVVEIDLDALAELSNSVTLYLWGCVDWMHEIGRSGP